MPGATVRARIPSVARSALAVDRPGNFLVRLERDDFDGDVVKTEGIVVERFPVHVHNEGVAHLGDDVSAGLHQHAGAVDGNMPPGIGEHGEDLAR